METYYRKRSKGATKETNETMIMERPENGSVDGARSSPALVRQILPISNCTPHDVSTNDVSTDHVELGSVYEIEHQFLPPRTPIQLKSTRIVMVSEKTDLNIAIRYPSMKSLQTYFNGKIKEMYPALDEKFVMGIKLAGKVLYRQVPSQEFAEKKYMEDFWMVKPLAPTSPTASGFGNVITKKEDEPGLVTELKGNGMLNWGIRRQVMFIGKHRHNLRKTRSHYSSFVQCQGNVKATVKRQKVVPEEDDEDDDDDNDDDDDDDDDDDGEAEEEKGDDDDEEEEEKETQNHSRKRKRRAGLRILQKSEKVKREMRVQVYKTKAKNKCKQIVSPTDRWSKERYKSAEQSLLEVMKEKGAVIGNPILRPALRAEARKRIGDTGLLDHLLKHVAGKIAPGGDQRFRRWHNAEGAMEYWLEDPELINIRREAGVKDPFWTPPPGWNPGDPPTQDPICAKELKFLKEDILQIKGSMEDMMSKKDFEEEMAALRRDMAEMVSKKQFLEELANFRREMEELLSQKQQNESQVAVVSEPIHGAIGPAELELSSSLIPLESQLIADDRFIPVEKYKEQMLAVSDFLKKIEVWMKGEVISKGKGKTKSGSELIATAKSLAEKETKKQDAVALKGGDEEERSVVVDDQPKVAAATEEKAAKIERLKSGFRICKPQGTFLWPNMARNRNPTSSDTGTMSTHPQVVVQVEDLFVVPTPPSVSSSTASNPPQLPGPPSPVKPLAERRAVTVTVSTMSPDGATTKSGNKTTTLINLNDVPTNQPSKRCYVSHSHQTVTTTTVMPNHLILPSGMKKEMMMTMLSSSGSGSGEGGSCSKPIMKGTTKQQRCSGGKISSSSSASSNTGSTPTWLALASPYPAASDQYSSRG